MDKLIVISILIFTCFCSRAQNLVPNNGFDIYTTCPNTGSQFNLTPPWSVLNNTIGSPDYFNACDTVGTQGVPTNNFGYQQAVSNSGYYGLITYFEHNELREYLTVPLISPLAPGKTYTIALGSSDPGDDRPIADRLQDLARRPVRRIEARHPAFPKPGHGRRDNLRRAAGAGKPRSACHR